MMSKEELVLGIDIGGSHITVGFVDLDTQQILQESYFRTFVNSWGSAEEIVQAWSVVIKKAFDTVQIGEKKIGIAMPGPFDYEAGVSYIRGNKKYDSLYGLNIKQLLAEKLDIAQTNILIYNDAECFLKGEAFAGAATGYKKTIGLTLGTGLGTAVYDSGITSDAALWNSPMFNGVAEDYISTRWFLKQYFATTGLNIPDVKSLNNICSTSAAARGVFKTFAENLAIFLEKFVTKESPEVIIIGGNIAKASLRFIPKLITCLEKMNIHIPVEISTLGESAALLGAASCWQQRDFYLQESE